MEDCKKLSMAHSVCFDMVERCKDAIGNISGDVVECGVLRGGMSIFLANTFPTKDIWVVDSFCGFQNVRTAKYLYSDPHDFDNEDMKVSLEEVSENFAKHGYGGDPRIHFLKGYVVDVLPPDVCEIRDIAILRIDVDSYSATMEVLDYLFPKVVSGGYVIFDDSCLPVALSAVVDYFKRVGLVLKLMKARGEEDVQRDSHLIGCCCYMIKE